MYSTKRQHIESSLLRILAHFRAALGFKNAGAARRCGKTGLLLLPMLAPLAGCSSAELQDAVASCNSLIANRYAEQMGQVDVDDMLRNTQSRADGTVSVTSTITFRAGTSSEHSQRYTCNVAIHDQAGNYQPRVIGLQIDPVAMKSG